MSDIIIKGESAKPQGDKPGAPKIEFPCRYMIKVLGVDDLTFIPFVQSVMRDHDAAYDGNHKLNKSSKGKFVSVTVYIMSTGEEQLRAIDKQLKANKQVKMVI